MLAAEPVPLAVLSDTEVIALHEFFTGRWRHAEDPDAAEWLRGMVNALVDDYERRQGEAMLPRATLATLDAEMLAHTLSGITLTLC